LLITVIHNLLCVMFCWQTNGVVNDEDSETSKLGEDCNVIGSPLKLHDYLADVQLTDTPTSHSNVATCYRRPVSIKNARYATKSHTRSRLSSLNVMNYVT